jgi:flagellar basal-body rod protein FlgB
MSSPLFDKTTSALNAAIQFRQLRQDVISSNIANAETPGFKAKKMDFEQALARAVDIEGKGKMTADHQDHYLVGGGSISRVSPDVYDNPEGQTNNDMNNVDLEKEMAQLGENSILYKTAIQLINKKMAALRYAATEGNR